MSLPAGIDKRLGALVRWAQAALANRSESARLDAELLLAATAQVSRARLRAFPEQPLDAAACRSFAKLVAARADGVPIAYLVGRKEFYSLGLSVTPAVLVPRPETELLVEQALERLPIERDDRVLDLGTGSGAIALAVQAARPRSRVTGIDLSASALEVARANAHALGLELEWLEGDWFGALAPGRRFELVLANPPYVESSALGGDLRHEPRLALDGGLDGLDALRQIVAAAPRFLTPRGWLLLEHGAAQRGALLELAAAAGFAGGVGYADLAGHDRVLALEAPP